MHRLALLMIDLSSPHIMDDKVRSTLRPDCPSAHHHQDYASGYLLHGKKQHNCCFLKSTLPALSSGGYWPPNSDQQSVVYEVVKPRITCMCGWDNNDGSGGWLTERITAFASDHPHGCTLVDPRNGAPSKRFGHCLGKKSSTGRSCQRCTA